MNAYIRIYYICISIAYLVARFASAPLLAVPKTFVTSRGSMALEPRTPSKRRRRPPSCADAVLGDDPVVSL